MSKVEVEIVAEIAEAFYRLKKELAKELPKSKYKEQEAILSEQWWEDVKRYFGHI